MYSRNGPFRPHLIALRESVLALFQSDTFGKMLRYWTDAVNNMSTIEIKQRSYKGCIIDLKRKNKWTDPGNFIYSLMWTLLGHAADFIIKRADGSSPAAAFIAIQQQVHKRWPRKPDSARLAEIHGDMFEFLLACGYLHDADMPIVHTLSVPICEIRGIVDYVEHHGAFDWTRDSNARSPFCHPRSAWIQKTAILLWNGMQVQYYGIVDGEQKWPGYRRAAETVNLTYQRQHLDDGHLLSG